MKSADPVREIYDDFAEVYDDFSSENDYEMWLKILLPELARLGLNRGSLLDVACGTGKAIGPMLNRGWQVTACDVSPKMIGKAIEKHSRGVRFDICDMRRLPVYSEFDLVWALNDPVNYLLDDADLELALTRMSANLAVGGLLVFDCNTSRLFRELFDPDVEVVRHGLWTWRGLGGTSDVYQAEISGQDLTVQVQRQRYRMVAEVQEAILGAGLVPVAAIGQREVDGRVILSAAADDARDHKVVHVIERA